MGKTMVSHRLDDGLAAWAREYAKTRGTTRSVIVEEALRAFQGLAEGGVPGLPVTDTAEVRARRAEQVPGVRRASALVTGPDEHARLMAERQRRVNAMGKKP